MITPFAAVLYSEHEDFHHSPTAQPIVIKFVGNHKILISRSVVREGYMATYNTGDHIFAAKGFYDTIEAAEKAALKLVEAVKCLPKF